MNSVNIFRKGMIMMLISQMIFSLIAPAAVSAQEGTQSPASFQTIDTNQLSASSSDGVLLAPANTTLSVSILSSPWTPLDHNDPNGTGGEVPKVFVVEAEITNTGIEIANNLVVSLNYNNPANNWVLLPGENPVRTVDELAPGEVYYAYWFARYSTVIGANFQYSVTASADNANPVTTSDNFYGNPAPNKTVETRSYISTGNSGVVQTSANVIVGVAFTVTVNYDLGNSPVGVLFSPVGNVDFDADAYRLLAAQVRLFNDAGTQSTTVNDRLYFDSLPLFAENAEVSYTFIALTPGTTRLCPYGAVDFGSTDKYDNFYCQDNLSTSITIDGSLSVEMTKQVSSSIIQQGQFLTYTIQYTNTGTASLQYVWIWDDVDTALATIDSGSISPPPDPDETTNSRIAWNIGNIAAGGQPGSTGTLSFSVLVDGNGADIPDNTTLANNAFFGIDPGSLPSVSALSSTTTTLIQAPTLSLSKTDGKTFAGPGDLSTYTLNVTNNGSLSAAGLVITDVLPVNLTLAGAPVPPPDLTNGQTLVWNSLGPIATGGGSVTIEIPVTLDIMAPNGTVLNNQMAVQYENPSGYRFNNKTANDTTTVNAPVLSISKSDSPDPVLTGNDLVYTLHYANTGPASATNAIITDTVPMSTTYQSCSGGSSCNENSGIVTWNLGAIPANSSGDVFLTVRVDDFLATGTVITNDDYGLKSDQSGFVAGAAETTLVNRDAAIIQGHAFEDMDGDGVKDPGETTGFSNLTVSLYSTALPLTTTTTDINGFYSFRLELGLPISVTAEIPANNFRTTPGEFYLQATLGITQTVNFGYAADASPFGVVFGTVFEDENHNGSQGLGEAGLPSVEIAGTSAATSPVFTNEYGQYTLRFDNNTNTTVAETNPAGYVSTTPDEVQLNVVTGSSNGSPVDFGDFQGIKITGQVFEDLNVDGTKDAGEGGLSGASVSANNANITTDSTGFYTMYLSLSDSSPILITEIDPAGYVSTNAIAGNGMTRVGSNALQIDTPLSGTVYANAYFGDALTSNVVTIAGQVWNDNGAGGGGLANGQRDGTEPGLAGALIQLSSGVSQTTTAGGNFLLYAPPGQAITLMETNPGGYLSTNAIPGNNASKIDHDTLLIGSLSGGLTSSGNLFGDVLASNVAVISGTVFDDSDENGQFNGGESGIPNVLVTLEYETGSTVSILTDSNGEYQFTAAPGAMLRILSAGPGGTYYPTTPESLYFVPAVAGTYPDNNFGYSDDGDVAVITGIVFDDVNSDGDQDFGEPGLAGAVITLDGTNPITTTGNGLITGTFTYNVSQVDIYSLHETNPPGYRSSTPDDLNVVVSSLGDSYYVDFGDTNSDATGTVFGLVFDDLNGNGLQEVGEPGLPGVVISMTVTGGVVTATTKSFGQYTYGFEV
ncbi:MAG TPA: SdrD B-like domain-containing protein, partial [Anaerolineales bacterium]|nr:SdrD B-like domain-containing protein [Anaerolineales bacterium]